MKYVIVALPHTHLLFKPPPPQTPSYFGCWSFLGGGSVVIIYSLFAVAPIGFDLFVRSLFVVEYSVAFPVLQSSNHLSGKESYLLYFCCLH